MCLPLNHPCAPQPEEKKKSEAKNMPFSLAVITSSPMLEILAYQICQRSPEKTVKIPFSISM